MLTHGLLSRLRHRRHRGFKYGPRPAHRAPAPPTGDAASDAPARPRPPMTQASEARPLPSPGPAPPKGAGNQASRCSLPLAASSKELLSALF